MSFKVTWTVERSGGGAYTRYPVCWYADNYEVESNFSMGKTREEANARAKVYAETKLTPERIRRLLTEDMDASFEQIERKEAELAVLRKRLRGLSLRLAQEGDIK